jgi:hypothetical protein
MRLDGWTKSAFLFERPNSYLRRVKQGSFSCSNNLIEGTVLKRSDGTERYARVYFCCENPSLDFSMCDTKEKTKSIPVSSMKLVEVISPNVFKITLKQNCYIILEC